MYSDVGVFPAPHLRIRQDELNRMCSFREPQCVSCVCFHPHVPNKIETLRKTKTESDHLQMICVYRRRLYNPAFHKLTYERLMQPFIPNHHWFDSDFKLPWVNTLICDAFYIWMFSPTLTASWSYPLCVSIFVITEAPSVGVVASGISSV